MDYTSLPLVTDLKFEGQPLRQFMSPTVPSDPYEAETVFDTWLYPIVSGEGNSTRELAEIGGQDLCEFVTLDRAGRNLTIQEATVRLLYALGNAEGAALDFSAGAIYVRHGGLTYGVEDGVVHSRFSEGLNLGDMPILQVLTTTQKVKTYNTYFCRLYREAYRRGKGLPEVMVALHMGQPSFDWRSLAELAKPDQRPSNAKFRQWESLLLNKKDPIHALYVALVPMWMTVYEFNRSIGRLSTRPVAPSANQIQLCINRLHDFFTTRITRTSK